MPSEELFVGTPRQELGAACADDPAVIKDFLFADAWEMGLAPGLAAFLRVRQIRRANAVRVVEDRRTQNSSNHRK
jgi:hypothetical protein